MMHSYHPKCLMLFSNTYGQLTLTEPYLMISHFSHWSRFWRRQLADDRRDGRSTFQSPQGVSAPLTSKFTLTILTRRPLIIDDRPLRRPIPRNQWPLLLTKPLMVVHSIIHTYAANICYIYFVQSHPYWIHVRSAVTGVGGGEHLAHLLCDRQSHCCWWQTLWLTQPYICAGQTNTFVQVKQIICAGQTNSKENNKHVCAARFASRSTFQQVIPCKTFITYKRGPSLNIGQ